MRERWYGYKWLMICASNPKIVGWNPKRGIYELPHLCPCTKHLTPRNPRGIFPVENCTVDLVKEVFLNKKQWKVKFSSTLESPYSVYTSLAFVLSKDGERNTSLFSHIHSLHIHVHLWVSLLCRCTVNPTSLGIIKNYLHPHTYLNRHFSELWNRTPSIIQSDAKALKC